MSPTNLGRYEITGILGRGAMGVVYRAHDPLIERTVAIKTVACAGLPEKEAEEFEQRFFREAKSAGRLNHQNIVTIHDVGRSDDLAYIAMEFLTGRSLRQILDSGPPIACERIIEIAAAVADGLAFAHAQGIVHRDIKPANIMVLENGVVKITDFGIAQLPGGSLTMAGAVLGSPKYMSPEQVAGLKADGRADIFSLGTVLYEMLTGQPPFSGNNMHATMYQVVHQTPPPPSSYSPSLQQAFDPIVARAMAKDPADRYQSAAEMAADLRKAQFSTASTLSGETGSQGSTVSPPEEKSAATAPSDRRQPLGYLRKGAVIALLAIIVGTVSAFFLLRPSAPTAEPQLAARESTVANVPPVAPLKTPADRPPKEQKANRDTSPATKAAAPSNWKDALRAELKACEEQSVFKRVVCAEKARWKHCPGHWGTIGDCPASSGEQNP